MKICPYCRNKVEDTCKFCTSCGAPLDNAEPAAEVPETPAVEPTDIEPAQEPQQQEPQQPVNETPPTYNPQPSYYSQKPEPVAIGGYIAWSILCILLCTIPGAIGLFYVLKINKATTLEEQQNTIKTAKIILTVGTVLGVLSLIGQLGAR